MMTFYTVSHLITELRSRLRDELAQRWSDVEIRHALSDALAGWNGRVRLPMLYTLPDGWSGNALEYALPAYVVAPLTPQYQAPAVYGFASSSDNTAAPDRTWVDFSWYAVEPDGQAGRVLRLSRLLNAPGRILYWVDQGDLPTGNGALDGAHTASVAALSLLDLDDKTPLHGAVRLGGVEWCFYSGVDWGALQLLNVQRAVSGASQSHGDATTVEWGVCAPETRLFNQLYDQAQSWLHSLYLTDASAQERSHHERLVMFYEDRAAKFWRNWTPQRSPRLIGGANG